MKLICVLLVSLYSIIFNSNAQIVFKKTVSGNIINYPMKAYASDSTFKILFWNIFHE